MKFARSGDIKQDDPNLKKTKTHILSHMWVLDCKPQHTNTYIYI